MAADDACLAAGAWPAGAEPANQYYRARYYDPSGAVFGSEDPIRFGGGLNFYAYANGNPVTFADPLGLRANLNLFNPSEKQRVIRRTAYGTYVYDVSPYAAAEFVPSEQGVFIVAGHSNAGVGSVPTAVKRPDGTNMTFAELAQMISAHKDYKTGMRVKLLICGAARGNASTPSMQSVVREKLGARVTACKSQALWDDNSLERTWGCVLVDDAGKVVPID